MPTPTDPRVRNLRARIAINTRWGDTDAARDARRELDVYMVERDLRAIAPHLTFAERRDFAQIALGGKP